MLNYGAISMAYGARPVPQNIMSVEFKLFDFMTLRQFIMTFVVLVVSGLFFVFLPGAWKVVVPLFLCMFGGIVIFVPFNGEPFQDFLGSYLEAMILPQRRVWHRKGVVLKSAMDRARFYRYGNDPKADDEANTFKYTEAEKIRITPEQQNLDIEEQKFIHEQEMDQKQQNQRTYQPPTGRAVQPQPSTNPGVSGTNVSARTVHTNVNLNQIPRQQQVQPQQVQPQAQTAQPEMPKHLTSESQIPPVQQQIQPQFVQQLPPQEPVIQMPQQVQQTPVEPQNNVNNQVTHLSTEQSASVIPAVLPPQPVVQQPEATLPQQPQYAAQVAMAQHLEPQIQQQAPQPASQPQVVEQVPQVAIEPVQQAPVVPQEPVETPEHHEAMVKQAMEELKTMMTPHAQQAEPAETDEFAPENYIFGNVEKDEDHPVKNAAVVIKKDDKVLEAVYTNENGEFQSHYEYREGDYVLHVNLDSKEFNEVAIHHDPIDAMPVIIKPKAYVEPVASVIEDDDLMIAPTSSDVFDGTYDSHSFDLGQEYVEPTNIAADVVQPVYTEVQPHIDDYAFENSVMTSAEQREEVITQPVQASVAPIEPAVELQPVPAYTEPAPVLAVETQPQVSAAPPVAPSVNEFDFASLPNSDSVFEPMYSQIPNTINGAVLDSANTALAGVLIYVKDENATIVRTIATDPQGRFYTFAPLALGRFEIEFIKAGYTFAKYFVQFNGTVITPKAIRGIQELN